MSALAVFESDRWAVRTIQIDGAPWFVAADVCRALDIGNSRDAVASLDNDEKGVANADTPGGAQQMSVISEPGLYSLVLRSRKPEAREFKRWITHEVLPAIRRTGQYVPAPAPERTPAQLIAMIANELVAQEARVAALEVQASNAGHTAREAMELAELANAKVDRRHPDNPDLTPITPTTIGQRLTPPVSGRRANELLAAAGFQWHQNGGWTATSDGRPYAVVEHGEHPETGFPFTQLKWQARIVPVLERRLARRRAIAGGAS